MSSLTEPAAGSVDAYAPTAGAPEPGDGLDDLDLPVVSPRRYRVAGEHGRGGIGRVSQARDLRLDRPVAIKELHTGTGPVAAARFVREALITARLQHPGIVPVYDAGRWPDGEPFYTMKLISGRSLHDAIAARATLEERLGLLPSVLAVAETIAYAHGQGVIHRDLKPANVVVGEYGETIVIDWGLAKDRALADEVEAGAADSLYELAHAGLTGLGSVVGTPAYMPAEQARGEPVDERADVYAIGAILYRLLAGVAPYDGDTAQVMAQVLAGPAPALAERAARVPRDLAAIVDKAMARAPRDRYPTAKELAHDLSRFLTGQLVAARAYSRPALVWRFLRRRRLLVGASLVVLAVLAVSGRRIVQERDSARAMNAELILTQARALLDHDPTAAVAWLEKYPVGGEAWKEVQAIAAEASGRGIARHVWPEQGGEVYAASFAPGGRTVASASADAISSFDAEGGARLARIEGGARCIAFAGEGRWLLAGLESGEVVAFDRRAGAASDRVAAHARWVNQVLVASDGEHFYSSGSDNTIRTWRLGADGVIIGPERELRGHTGLVDVILLDRRGRLWSSSRDGTVRRWDPATGAGEIVLQLDGTRPFAPAAISDDGEVLLTTAGERVILWRAGQWRELGRLAAPAATVVLRRDGSAGATGDEDGVVSWWNDEGLMRHFSGHERPVRVLRLAGDGESIASGDTSGTIRVWRHGQVRTLAGHRRAVESLEFAPDGRSLLSASDDGSARVWPLTDEGTFTRVAESALYRVGFAAGGRQLVTTSRDGGVRVVDRATGRVDSLGSHSLAAYDLALLPGGAGALSSSWDGTLELWDLAGGQAVHEWNHGARLWSVDVAPDGRSAVSAGVDGAVRLWSFDGAPGWRVAQHVGPAHDAVFSPDGEHVASSGEAPTILVTSRQGDTPIELHGHQGAVTVLAFSPDGETLFSCGFDGSVRAWDWRRGRGTVVARHRRFVRTLAVSPDGRWLASGGGDDEIQLHDLQTGRTQIRRGHQGEVRHLAFSPDGQWLASAGWDETVRLWSMPDGRVTVLRGHAGLVHRVAFSPDGQWLASAGDDGAVGLWKVSAAKQVPAEPGSLTAWLRRSTSATVGTDAPLATSR